MNEPRLFDLEIINPCRHDPGEEAHQIVGDSCSPQFWTQRGFLGVNLTLIVVKRLAKALSLAGGGCLVVPSAYREPLISPEQAWEIAERRYQEIRIERGDIFGPLEHGRDQSMWWQFRADNLPALAAGLEPGSLFINVDKLDGHVVTDSDWATYVDWQKRR